MDDPSVSPLPAASPVSPTIGGVTRTMEASQAEQSASIRTSVRGQALSWMLFIVALLPPTALVLADGLSGAARDIPYAALWAWGALALSILLTARSGLAAGSSQRASALTGLALPVVLLLAAIVVLWLRLRLVPASHSVAIAQVVVYALCSLALLLSPTATARTR